MLHFCYLDYKRLEWVRAREVANQALTDVAIGDLHQINTAITQARIQVDAAYAKLQNAEAFTSHIENQLAIEERWIVGGENYIKYKEEATLQKYRVALDELERLVVMRLFELSKLSLSGTGKFTLRYLKFQPKLIAIGRIQVTATNWKSLTETLRRNSEHHQQI